MSVTQPILFVDFDGTLCHDRFWRSLSRDQYASVQEILFGEDRTLVQEWMVGKHTSEDINKLLSEQLRIPYAELWNIFVQDAKNMKVSSKVLQTIHTLRSRYTTILITVNMDSFSRFTVSALALDRYFDAISNSYYEGTFKGDNDGEIFRNYLEKYGAPIRSSVLVDDSLSVCETFRRLGGRAMQVTKERDVLCHLNALRK